MKVEIAPCDPASYHGAYQMLIDGKPFNHVTGYTIKHKAGLPPHLVLDLGSVQARIEANVVLDLTDVADAVLEAFAAERDRRLESVRHMREAMAKHREGRV